MEFDDAPLMGFYQKIEHEGAPKYCKNYKKIGHNIIEYRVLARINNRGSHALDALSNVQENAREDVEIKQTNNEVLENNLQTDKLQHVIEQQINGEQAIQELPEKKNRKKANKKKKMAKKKNKVLFKTVAPTKFKDKRRKDKAEIAQLQEEHQKEKEPPDIIQETQVEQQEANTRLEASNEDITHISDTENGTMNEKDNERIKGKGIDGNEHEEPEEGEIQSLTLPPFNRDSAGLNLFVDLRCEIQNDQKKGDKKTENKDQMEGETPTEARKQHVQEDNKQQRKTKGKEDTNRGRKESKNVGRNQALSVDSTGSKINREEWHDIGKKSKGWKKHYRNKRKDQKQEENRENKYKTNTTTGIQETNKETKFPTPFNP
ncbi:uncharacterized protein LOC132612943 [Lycium barbarum]|uniref:uncharacterized protein LOC132612943 n=1 Tax=Lycium barbarum TaxID=112863 RepID=UPI00293EBE7C|nr:uncharacterized protein LOC132612943 [Lycium barbarum]